MATGGRHKSRYPESEEVKLSKSLSSLLRHNFEKEGLKAQPGGYIFIDEMMTLPKFKRHSVAQVKSVVESNDKQRFTIKPHLDGRLMIRANQGHSVKFGREMPRKRRRDQKERPDGWPLHFYVTITTTADTWYDFVVYRRMRIWQLKKISRMIIFEGEDLPLDTMAVVYGGVVLKSKKMIKEYRVSEAGYAMVLKGFEVDWPENAEEIEDVNDIDERDIEEFMKTAKPSDVGYLDMGPEPDKDAPLEVPQEVIDFWVEQGVDMTEKNIVPEPDIKAIAAKVQRDTGYLPEPSRPPGEKQMGVEVAAIDADTLELKPEPVVDPTAAPLPPHERKIVHEEKELEKALILPPDFEEQMTQLLEDISEGKYYHSREVVKEVYIKSNFNFEDTVNKLLITRTQEIEEEIAEDAETWHKVELTDQDNEDIQEIMESCENKVTKEEVTQAFVESGKKFEETLDFLNK